MRSPPPPLVYMRWPTDRPGGPVVPEAPPGYALVHETLAEDAFAALQAAAGWTMRPGQWAELSAALLPGGMCTVRSGGAPVAVACVRRAGPAEAELAWVAVSPAHRGRRLARVVSAAVTRVGLDAGLAVTLSTTPDRAAALATYRALGFLADSPESAPSDHERASGEL